MHPVWSFDVILPVYKVTIELDPDVPDAVKNITGFGNWQDVSDGSYYGSTKTVYLENGTHHLTCRKSISGVIYNFYLDVTVNGYCNCYCYHPCQKSSHRQNISSFFHLYSPSVVSLICSHPNLIP